MTEYTIHVLELALTTIGVAIAAIGILYAIKTLRDNGTIAHAQFFATVRGLMANYDDVHVKFRPGGDWAPAEGKRYAHTGPDKPQEWARVELYMGLFEFCEVLLKRGLMEQEDFNRSFLYRLENLMLSGVIVKTKLLSSLKGGWIDFLSLCDRCNVHVPSKEEIEADELLAAQERTIAELHRALEKAGVEFISENGGGAGVRMKKRPTKR
jgi:hypothetical protein